MTDTYTESYYEVKNGYYIDYEVTFSIDNNIMGITLDAKVFEGPTPLLDRGSKVIFEILCKWDDCNHLRMPYFHFDGIDEFDELIKIIKYIHCDLCHKHGVYG